ncbi:oligosaccharide flippase family protein [Clostridium fessum]|uniref:oligosaccharide flippase family protein n=1 Tax=Clostridium fessum TaxID=2126740 RepID=UPI0022E44DAE|nr:oligosaccharide flippase family protein [Clostridium fessum]
MSKEKSSNRIVAFNLAGKFLLNGINFFVVSIFTRMLGTENFGLFSLYLTWESIVLIFVGLQTQSIIGNVSMKYDKQERCRFLSSNIFLSFVMFAELWLIFLMFKNRISSFMGLPPVIVGFMLIHALTNYGVNIVTGVWSFDKEAEKNFFVSLILSLTNIILSIWFINSIQEYDNKYIGRIVGSALPTIVMGSGSIIFILAKGRTLFNKEYWKYTLGFSIPIVFHALSNLILNQSDRIMLQKIGSLREVGIYSVIFTLTNVLSILMDAFNTAWVPFFYEDLKTRKLENIRAKTKNYVNLFSFLTVGFLLLAPEVLSWYAGDEYTIKAKALPFLAVGVFFTFLYSFPINYKYYKGKTKSIAVGTVGAGLCNIVLNALLIPQYGILGAAVATVISYILLWIFHYVGAIRLDKEAYPYSLSLFLPNIIVIVIVAIFAYVIVYDFPIIRWGLAVIDGLIMLCSVIKRKTIW